MEEYPKKSKNIIYIDSVPKKIIYNKSNGHEYYLGAKEAAVYHMLDGTNSLGILAERSGLPESGLRALIAFFYEEGLIEGNAKKHQPVFRIRLFRKYLPVNQWKQSTALIIQNIIFFSFVLSLFITGVAGCYLCIRGSLKADLLNDSFLSLKAFVTLILSLFISVFFHEFIHAISSVANGAYVVEMGLMLQYFLPCAYVSVCGVKNITDKSKIIKILSSGCAGNGIFIGITGLKCFILNNISKTDLIFVMVNVSIIALNCILFLRNDANQLLKLLLGKNTRKNKGSVFRSIRGKTGEETILTALNSIIFVAGIFLIAWIKLTAHNTYKAGIMLCLLAIIVLLNFIAVVITSFIRPYEIAARYCRIYTNIIKLCIIITPLFIRYLPTAQFAAVVFVSFVISDFLYTLDVVILYFITKRKLSGDCNE